MSWWKGRWNTSLTRAGTTYGAPWEKLQAVTDEEEWTELLCGLTPEETEALFRFLGGGFAEEGEKSTNSDGSSTEVKIKETGRAD
jgi:hypothetical protein